MKKVKNKTTSTVSKEICRWIVKKDISHVFLIPGVQIEPFVIELSLHDKLTPIVACHELGAGFMADGYSRASGNYGVCASIGGPGASYMLASAMVDRMDESPVLFITGDTPTYLNNYFCFQDTGKSGSRDSQAYKALIDASETIKKPEDTFSILSQIEERLSSNLPAHLVIPCDIQESKTIEFQKIEAYYSNNFRITKEEVINGIAKNIVESLNNAKHPVILAGHRILDMNGIKYLKQIAESTGTAVATTYRAKGAFPESHPLSLGIFGYSGTKTAHNAILGDDCDLLIILGANFSQRNTFNFHEKFIAKGRKTLVVDTKDTNQLIENPDFYKFKVNTIHSLLKVVAEKLNDIKTEGKQNSFSLPWSKFNTTAAIISDSRYPRLDYTLQKLRTATPPDTMFFVDSGSHRVVAGGAWEVSEPFTFFTSDLAAPMGWAICAAIGAKLARPKTPTIVLTGDGCMRMHGMEIATAARYSVPIIYLVSNNASYSSVQKRVQLTTAKEQLGKLPLIDWSEFAKSIGADGCIVSKPDQIDQAIEQALKSKCPFVIDLRTNPEETFCDNITIPEYVWPDIL